MLRIYLARHGQDEDNAKGILNGHRDKPLTKLGEEQAGELAQKIKSAGIKFDKVYASPLVRAFRTAEIIINSLELPKPEKMDLLIERDFGIMTGKPQTEIIDMCSPNVLSIDGGINYFLCPEGAETFPQLVKRGKRLITDIENKYKGGNVLLVTHGDFGKMVYAAYYDLDWKEVLKMFHFGNSDLILLAPDSASEDVHVFKIKQHNL